MIINKTIKIISISFFALLYSCSSPGMFMENSQRSDNKEYVFVESIDANIEVLDISESIGKGHTKKDVSYRIGNGDQIAITIWGLPEIFPVNVMNPDINLRRVDSNGNIYFPYIGLITAFGKTQDELRSEMTLRLSEFFNEPQLDVSIARFNSQKIYLLGEITQPQKIFITDVPLSLSEALGEAKGLRTETSEGSQVYIVRQLKEVNFAVIYRANLDSPAGFAAANNFYLEDNDIIYVNASRTTRWNRVISQFFPFSSFLNSVDSLLQDN